MNAKLQDIINEYIQIFESLDIFDPDSLDVAKDLINDMNFEFKPILSNRGKYLETHQELFNIYDKINLYINTGIR